MSSAPLSDNWSPSPAEKPYYDLLFQEADVEKMMRIGGKQAVEFLQRSSLPTTTLKEIWNLCENKHLHVLEKDGFALACRLIALAQNNIPIAPGVADATASKVLLPVFQGITTPVIPTPTPPVINPTPVSVNPSLSPSGDVWAVTAEEKSKYASIFAANDTDNDGFISGGEAASFFAKSGALTEVLRAVWNLSDIDRDGQLTLNEFMVAMHLTVKIMKFSLPVPESLPPSILSAFFAVPETSSNTPISMERPMTPMKNFESLGTIEEEKSNTQFNQFRTNLDTQAVSTPTMESASVMTPTIVKTTTVNAVPAISNDAYGSLSKAVEETKRIGSSTFSNVPDTLGSLRDSGVADKLKEHVNSLKSEMSDLQDQVRLFN
jgi:hypothetical protein